MKTFDRLSALVNSFELSVTSSETAEANLVVFATPSSGCLTRILFAPEKKIVQSGLDHEMVVLNAHVDWGGDDNPISTAFPQSLELFLSNDPEMKGLAQILVNENTLARCGSASVVNRLGEILVVRLLRYQLEKGTIRTGLLGGLSDKRLSRAIVAMHEYPHKIWNIDDLASLAGLSSSRFAQLFKSTVGQTPLAYLRTWRLSLAKQDIERGDRIMSVARRYGYSSPEALSRAFYRKYNVNPITLRAKIRD